MRHTNFYKFCICIFVIITIISLCLDVQAKEAMPYSYQAGDRINRAIDRVELPTCGGNEGDKEVCFYRYIKNVFNVAGYDLDKTIIKVVKDLDNKVSTNTILATAGGKLVFRVITGLTEAGGKYEIESQLPKSTFAVLSKQIYSKREKTREQFREQTRKEKERVNRFKAYNNDIVLDIKTNLMWASRDNGSNITWEDAKSYCENYRGGGYTDWRMPGQDELAELYDSAEAHQSGSCKHIKLTGLIYLTNCSVWAAETQPRKNKRTYDKSAIFNFEGGERYWQPQNHFYKNVALPVRSLKLSNGKDNEEGNKELAILKPCDSSFSRIADSLIILSGGDTIGIGKSEQYWQDNTEKTNPAGPIVGIVVKQLTKEKEDSFRNDHINISKGSVYILKKQPGENFNRDSLKKANYFCSIEVSLTEEEIIKLLLVPETKQKKSKKRNR